MSVSSDTRAALWGPQVDLTGKKDLFWPQNVARFADIPGGIDNLRMTTVDTFEVPDQNGRLQEFTTVFRGYVRVVRDDPTTSDWRTSIVYTNMIDMQMESEETPFGKIQVQMRPGTICSGQITTPRAAQVAAVDAPAKDCRIAVAALFTIPRMPVSNGSGVQVAEVTLFNKEPIMLCIDGITTMPPGGAHGVGGFHKRLPLYDYARCDDPRIRPLAWLTRLDFDMGDYLPEEQALAYHRSTGSD